MKSKKLLSLLLALMMMLSVVPMYASAAEPIALTEANVTVWPTASGEIWFGQKLSDGITLSGGEVQYDGAVVEGRFEFVNPEYIPNRAGDAIMLSIKFVPDNSNFSGFELLDTDKVTGIIKKVTPDIVELPVATDVATAGTLLGKSKLSGGQLYNPYAPEESTLSKLTWAWVNRREAVNKSGYYEAVIGAGGYNQVKAMVYVRIASETPITQIVSLPTISDLTYNPNITWKDVKINAGKAVIENEDGTKTEVAGTFSFTNAWLDKTPAIGTYNVGVCFTPDDLTAASPYNMSIQATVNPGKLAFINEAGTETIPEITVPYGLKMNDDIGNYLKSYLNTSASFNFTETQYYNEYIPVGTHDLTVKASCSNANYESEAVLPFKLTVEPIETAVTVKYDINKDNKNTYEIYVVKADVDGARPQGNFAIYVDGQLLKDGAKYSEHITWSPEKSKAYTVKVVYTPTANDPCLVADTEITVDAKLYRNITTVNTSSDGTKQFRCGEKIQVAANVPEFSGWVITDAAGNTVDLGVDLSAKSIELAVPDFDVKLEAKGKTSSGSDGLGNIFDMDFGDLSEGDSEWAIINIIRNLIAKFKSFLQQLIETFQSIGD